jgi:hypothetical protein
MFTVLELLLNVNWTAKLTNRIRITETDQIPSITPFTRHDLPAI